jgi:hypothetical protein
MAVSRFQEHVIIFAASTDQAAVLAALKQAGGKVMHRFGREGMIVSFDKPEGEVARLLPPGARLLAAGDELPRGLSAGLARQLRAFRLRQSPEFRAAKLNVSTEVEWEADDLGSPEVKDGIQVHLREYAFGEVVGPPAPLEIPKNERLINDTAVGVVIVSGSGDYAISEDEKDHILAEVQEGLDWLGSLKPEANVSWVYDVQEASVNISPWAGFRWPKLPDKFYKGFDAAFLRHSNGKIYLFRKDQYVKLADIQSGPEANYPRPITEGWSGLPATFAEGIDAALYRQSNRKIYFFKGSEYVCFSDTSMEMEPGYPKPISEGWPGLPAEFKEGINAALMRKDNGKIYFFKGNQYVCYSNVSQGIDVNYPKPISEGWHGLPVEFQEGIDAALQTTDGKIYFFKKNKWYGRFVRISNGQDVDPGYEAGLPIGMSTEEAESRWRDPALTQLGYPVGYDGAAQHAAKIRDELQTQWGYTCFFSKYYTTVTGYSRGVKVIIYRPDFGPASDEVKKVSHTMAHETGHMFGAADEYGESVCGSEAGRFFKIGSHNCKTCVPDPNVPCFMRSTPGTICEYTPWQLGWGAFMTKIDAAVWRSDNSKIYLFSNDKCIQITNVSAGRDAGYPSDIKETFPGLPQDFQKGIDAALWRESTGALYLFKGSHYVRYDNLAGGGAPVGPLSLSAGEWSKLPASFQQGIDAAFWRESNSAIYLFKGSQYLRITKMSSGIDAGYPRPIAGNWPGLPADFHSGIDAVLMRRSNNKIYFFKGKQYMRYLDAENRADGDSPWSININWFPFPT